MAKIYLVRHTQVDIEQGICYGVSDVEPAATFNDDIIPVISGLKNIHFNRVISSPLIRCKKLAQILSKGEFITDNRLKELDFGDWELKTWNDIYETSYGKLWMENYLTLPCPNGESYIDMENRLIPGIDKTKINTNFYTDILSKAKPSDNILVVTHAGVIRILVRFLNKKIDGNAFNYAVPHGSVHCFDING
jgi:alpha-ribazole phosphatase